MHLISANSSVFYAVDYFVNHSSPYISFESGVKVIFYSPREMNTLILLLFYFSFPQLHNLVTLLVLPNLQICVYLRSSAVYFLITAKTFRIFWHSGFHGRIGYISAPDFNIKTVINIWRYPLRNHLRFILSSLKKIYVYMHINGKYGKKNCKRKLDRHHTETH